MIESHRLNDEVNNETSYLLSTQANAARLRQSLQAADRGECFEKELLEID
jgi:hypothetical protein